jgi:hypothetical protein
MLRGIYQQTAKMVYLLCLQFMAIFNNFLTNS